MRKVGNGWGVLMQDDIDTLLEGNEVRIPDGVTKLMLHVDAKDTMLLQRAITMSKMPQRKDEYVVSYKLNGPPVYSIPAQKILDWARANEKHLSSFSDVLVALHSVTGDNKIKDWVREVE